MRKISLILIISILCSALFAFPALGFEFSHITLNDIDRHWAESSIETLKSLGVLNGYKGYASPDAIITRGEFTAMITRAFAMKPTSAKNTFSDISSEHMFYENIMAASDRGIIDGFADNTFRPENMITREEIMLIISRLTPPSPIYSPDFSDIAQSYTYRAQLGKVTHDGIISGYPDGTFKPYEKTTRAEAASMILSAMKKYLPCEDYVTVINHAGEYLKNHFAGIYSNCIGSAMSDSLYLTHTLKKTKELGFSLTNEITDIAYTSFIQSGPFSTVKAEYYINRTLNGNAKKYKGSSEIKLFSINGQTKIYEHTTNIIEEKKINLTWEVFSSVPTVETPGINIVSPTCFRITTEPRQNDTASLITPAKDKPLYFNSFLKKEYVDYAKSKGYKIWAMYRTDFKTSTANELLSNPDARQNAANLLTENILKFDLDGINFDFENMYHTDRGAYSNHVREISVISHILGASVSVDITKYTSSSLNWSMCFDRDTLSKYTDYVAIMAYDQFASGSKTAGPVAGMNWTKQAIEITLKEVPASKLILGMPYYIRVWKIQNNKTIFSESVSMEKANEYAAKSGVTLDYDEKYGLNRFKWTENGYDYVFWMENADTIRQRVKMTNQYGLAGVASWRRGFETPDVWYSITDELNK
ncbi:MAG: S-layer homology domain-containing protein [Clostridia bacterium]|nr:S-layer homology domain-containing protein [Clostridia bacterium]